jgi:hypothetical protein
MSGTLHWDATFPLLRLDGAGTRNFLQGQTSADVTNTPEEALVQTCWLTATGRLRALLELRLWANGADVLVLAGDATAVSEGFDQVIFPADRVRLQPITEQRRVQPLSSNSVALWLNHNTPLPPNWTSDPADPHQFERWRIEQGLAIGPGELSANANPLELGLADHVSLSKGCYLGQETVAKLTNLGGTKQELRGWICNQVLPVGDVLRCNGELAGKITSALGTPEGSIGLALVRRKHLAAKTLDGSDGQSMQLQTLPMAQRPAVG